MPDSDLLRTGTNSDANLATPHGAQTYHYVTGLRAAIELVSKHFQDSDGDYHTADTLIFPLGLLCRHLIELRLKELYVALTGQEAEHIHELLKLWTTVRPSIEKRWPSANQSTAALYGHMPNKRLKEFGIEIRSEGRLDRAETLIRALHEVDPRGLSFRYPGELPQKVEALSLPNLADATFELDNFLDGLETGICEENRRRTEEEAEFREYADEGQ